MHHEGMSFLSPFFDFDTGVFFDGLLLRPVPLADRPHGLCTLMHLKTIQTEGAFGMLFVQIRTKKNHIFLRVSRYKHGFVHTNSPHISRFGLKMDCNFMMRYAH